MIKYITRHRTKGQGKKDIEKAIKKAGGKVLIIKSVEDFKSVDKVVIPGVGSFKEAMQELENDGFIPNPNLACM